VELAFDLAEAGPVRVDLYQPNGRLASTLWQGGQLPAGAQRLALTLPALSAGLYLLRVQAGTQQAVKRLVVLPD
jgi:hypothetical protein